MIGYVFYERPYDSLKGVSMRLVEDFAGLPYVEVSQETAEAFLRGDSDLAAWTVATDRDAPRLISLADLKVVLKWKDGWETIGEPIPAPVGITIRTGTGSRYVEAELSMQTAQMKLISHQTDRMRFVFTHAGDPDDIVSSISIPIRSLSESKRTVVQLDAPLPPRFDVHTIPFESVSYAVERHETISPLIPYPKGRHDALVRLRRENEDQAGLFAQYLDGRIIFSVKQGGGPRYDIGSRPTVVSVCRRGNPDLPITIKSFSTEEIENSCEIETGGYTFEEVDVYTALLYRDAFFIDGSCKT